jgi:hypothetical protein
MELRNEETFSWVNLRGRNRVGEVGWRIILKFTTYLHELLCDATD